MKNLIKNFIVLIFLGITITACGGGDGNNSPGGPNGSLSSNLSGKEFFLNASDLSTLRGQCPIFISISDDIRISFKGNSFELTNNGIRALAGKWNEASSNSITIAIDGRSEILLNLQINGDKITFNLADDLRNFNAGCSRNTPMVQLKVKGNVTFADGTTQIPPHSEVVVFVSARRAGLDKTVVEKVYKNSTSVPIAFSIDVPVEQITGAEYTVKAVLHWNTGSPSPPIGWQNYFSQSVIINPNAENETALQLSQPPPQGAR